MYTNRVLHYKEVPEIEPGRLPSLNEFIDGFNTQERGDYYRLHPIRWHALPLKKLIRGRFSYRPSEGDNANLLNDIKVYKFDDTGFHDLQKDALALFGRRFFTPVPVIPRKQTGGPKLKINKENLSEENLNKLLEFYKEDYEILAKWYQPGDIVREWEQN